MKKIIVKEISTPKVYAMLISSGDDEILWQEAAYSLENAFYQAKEKLRAKFPAIDVSKIDLFNVVTLDEAIESSLDIETKELSLGKEPKTEIEKILGKLEKDILKPLFEKEKEQEQQQKEQKKQEEIFEVAEEKIENMLSEKDALMKKIIENKDKELFNSNKDIFTDFELKYLKDKLKK